MTIEWTKADLQKLLATIKTNITDKDRMKVFYQGVKSVDWDKVAFPPFSPEACQEKWDETCRKVGLTLIILFQLTKKTSYRS